MAASVQVVALGDNDDVAAGADGVGPERAAVITARS